MENLKSSENLIKKIKKMDEQLFNKDEIINKIEYALKGLSQNNTDLYDIFISDLKKADLTVSLKDKLKFFIPAFESLLLNKNIEGENAPKPK